VVAELTQAGDYYLAEEYHQQVGLRMGGVGWAGVVPVALAICMCCEGRAL
jgi:hypothetical protein